MFALRQKVKSKASAFDEIERFTLGEIKSVLNPNEVRISPRRDFTARQGDFTRPERTDLVEKVRRLRVGLFLAGAERFELSTRGFGDRCSTS